MHVLLVAGSALSGLVIGAVLDPLGQRLADRSRAEEDRQHAVAAETSQAVAPGPPGPPAPNGPDESRGSELDAESAGPTPTGGSVTHLVPAGRSPVRTATVATITGALFGAAAAHFGADLVLAPFCVFFALMATVSVTDLSHRLVPRRLIYPALALIVPLLVATSAVDHRWRQLSGAGIAGAVAFALFFAVWWFVPRGMGFGDVRLAGVIGLTVGYLSLLHAYVGFLAGFAIGMVFGLVMMAVSGSGRRTRIPFAPSLAAGAVIAVFWGAHLAQSLFSASG